MHRDFELTPGEGVILRKIKHMEIDGNLTISGIGKELNTSKPAVSQFLKSLEEKGYIKRQASEKDRRYTLLSLTEKGEEMQVRMENQINARFAKVVEAYGAENIKELNEMLTLLGESCEEIFKGD